MSRSRAPFGRVNFARPNQLVQKFKVEKRTASREGGGRVYTWQTDTEVGDDGFVYGVLSAASSRDMVLAERADLTVSHQIVMRDAVPLKRGEHRLILADDTAPSSDSRYFTVESSENPGALDTFTILQVNERRPE